MALFGTFADVSFPDVVFLIGNGSGNLVVRQVNYDLAEQYELTLENGHIVRMLFNGQEIHSSEQAHSFITEVIRNSGGEFEFHRGPVAKGSLWISTMEAMLSSISMLDEMAGLKEHFPDPHTVFLETDQANGRLTPELQTFWFTIEPYFREGICAVDLSEKVGLFLDQILLKFYKLRTAEVIAPKRAFYAKTEPLPALELNRLEKNLGADMKALALTLQPIWAEPEPEAVAPLPEPVVLPDPVILPEPIRETIPTNGKNNTHAELPRPDFSSVQIYRPDKATSSGFMQSLKKLMRAS